MKLPQSINLVEIQEAFRAQQADIDKLTTGNIDMKKRRIINAGVSREPFDYVTAYELDHFLDGKNGTSAASGVENTLQIGEGFPKILIDSTNGIRVYDKFGQLVHTLSLVAL